MKCSGREYQSLICKAGLILLILVAYCRIIFLPEEVAVNVKDGQ